MSYSEMLGLTLSDPKVEPVVIAEYSNSHGMCPPVWNGFGKRYLNLPEGAWLAGPDGTFNAIWKLHERQDIPLAYRAVMRMTFDHAIVMREHYAQAAQHITEFVAEFCPMAGRVNHWPAIGAQFAALPNFEAVGFYPMSVGENLFEVPYDEEDNPLPMDYSEVYNVYGRP